MDILLAIGSIAAAAWLLLRHFERRLGTRSGPWIAKMKASHIPDVSLPSAGRILSMRVSYGDRDFLLFEELK